MLATSVGGRRRALDDRAVLRHFLANPTMTLAVVVKIYWAGLAYIAQAGEILSQASAAGRTGNPLIQTTT
jgi:DUF1365 family protein